MQHRWAITLLACCTLVALAARPAKRFYDTHDYYVLEHDTHSHTSLNELIAALDVELIEQAGELEDHWLVRVPKSPEHTEHKVLRRSEPHQSSIKFFELQVPRRLVKRAPPPPGWKLTLNANSSAKLVADRFGIVDPLFPEQWHLVNEENPEHMMNVTPVWEMGYTGKGIKSCLIDDGLDYTSEDLKDNFDADDSHDFNDHENLPTPKLIDDNHGTRCAGQIAAGKNSVCGIGIAYESKVAGVRILSGRITDVDEAASLNFGFQNVSIYSCSWGPRDDGRTMDGAPHMIRKAMLNGINKGRGGKGSIYVFASGNGAFSGDQCNFDGYTNSIYSVTVAAVDYKGLHPYYSEPCAANMVVAYSSGSGKSIVTTDRGVRECAKSHGGTSAAAPNAVGVYALALEARPDLTWRDVQYLSIETARFINPSDPDWELTYSGRRYSYKYGYGALDAGLFVEAALKWNLVKPQAWYKSHTVDLANGHMNGTVKKPVYSGGQPIPKDGVGIKSTIEVSRDLLKQHNLETLEHINVKVWISHGKRGDVEVELISPNGVRSILAGTRSGDTATTGFPGWTFMTIKHWGELPWGTWTIRVSDVKDSEKTGAFLGWNIHFWGSSIDPDKASLFQIPPDDTVFPPNDDLSDILPSATTTRVHSKPTANLPDDHGHAPGENTKAAFPGSTNSAGSAQASNAPGWAPGMAEMVANQKWLVGAIGASLIFGLGMGAYFYRRRQRARANYTAMDPDGNVMPMTDVGGTRELYDAFGEADDDDADENTRLRLADDPAYRDEDEARGRPRYRDEPVR